MCGLVRWRAWGGISKIEKIDCRNLRRCWSRRGAEPTPALGLFCGLDQKYLRKGIKRAAALSEIKTRREEIWGSRVHPSPVPPVYLPRGTRWKRQTREQKGSFLPDAARSGHERYPALSAATGTAK